MRKAFSLVELSIVLVILGLLVGGILAGQSLIRASELRAVGTEYQRYLTGVHTFRDKYFAVPGDWDNATSVWGKDNTNCTGDTGTTATPGTCNGDNNRQIGAAAGASLTGEGFQFWKQLALAGMIEGSYSGIAGSVGNTDAVPGSNVPASKMNNGAWYVVYSGTYGGDGAAYAYDYGNTMMFGGAITNFYTFGKILKPEEAWNIDTKLDDGKPGRGKIIPYYWDTCTEATAFNDYAANYALSEKAAECALYFVRSL